MAAMSITAGSAHAAPPSPPAPPPAFAGSAISAPANGAELFYDGDTGSGTMNLMGTVSQPTATAKGDLYCYSSGAMTPTKVLTGISVTTGSFNLDLALAPIAGQACRLALVPAGTVPLGMTALAPFAGPVISVSEQYSRSSDGNEYSYYVLSGAVEWSYALQSLGDCPVISSYATDPGTLASYSLFNGEGCLGASSGIAPAEGSRSALQVDGLNAYVPAAISQLAGEGGFQPLSWASTYANAAHDGVTVVENDTPVVCAPPGGYPPSASVCPSFSNAGISVRETTTILPGGQVARVSMRYASLDGKPHTIDLLLSQNVQAPGAGEFPGFEFPRQSQFAAHGAPDAFTLFPKRTSSILVLGDSVAAPSTSNPIGSITYSTPPHDADFVSAPGASTATMLLHYTRTLPARGGITLQFAYAESDTAAGLQPLEATERDRYNYPHVKVLAPRSGLRTARRFVIVHGRVSDGVGISSATVDGHRALRPKNRFSRRVRLKPGLNTITVIATNFGGRVAVARVRVRYVTARRHAVLLRPTLPPPFVIHGL